MRYLVMALTVLLAGMFFVLEVSKTYATSVEIHSISCEDEQGNIYFKEYFVTGASLDEFTLPEPPQKDGYMFIGWYELLPNEMPDADLIFVPMYVQQTFSINVTF